MRQLLKRSVLKTRLLAPLYTSFLLLVLLILVQAGLNLLVSRLQQQAVAAVTHTLLVEREGQRLLSAALDEETGLRGYLLTGDPASLAPYRSGQVAFRDSLDRLHRLVQDNPAQLQQLEAIQRVYDRWQTQFAQPALSGSSVSPTLAGKTVFDPLRSLVGTLLQREEILLEQRNQRLHQLNQLRTILDRFSLIAILIGVGVNLWLLHRRVEVPLRQLTAVAQGWRDGHMEVRLNHPTADEIGQLARVLDAMATEIRDRQQRIELRNHQLEDLISALSHDLRTPLLAARTALRPMLNGAFGPVNETWREVLEEFQQSNESLLKLVNLLLDISRYEAGAGQLIAEPLDWSMIFGQAQAQTTAVSGYQPPIVCTIPPSLPPVYGDPIEIQRVVQNLLDNAVRVSPADRPVQLEVEPAADQIRVSVCDQGPGVAPQEQARLFHRFIQGRGRRGGAGLGLYLCRQIIEAHRGSIGVDSSLGAGSKFWFTLPIAQGGSQDWESEHDTESGRRGDAES